MKKVKRTKQPTLRQMLNMASNLQNKYKLFSSVEVHTVVFSSGDEKINYWLSTQGVFGEFLSSWKEVFDKYEKLLEAPNA